jgi:hypothetical protein
MDKKPTNALEAHILLVRWLTEIDEEMDELRAERTKVKKLIRRAQAAQMEAALDAHEPKVAA